MVLNYRDISFFKQKTAYEIDCDWSSDVCSSDLTPSLITLFLVSLQVYFLCLSMGLGDFIALFASFPTFPPFSCQFFSLFSSLFFLFPTLYSSSLATTLTLHCWHGRPACYRIFHQRQM